MSLNGFGWLIAALFGIFSLSALVWTQIENKKRVRNNQFNYDVANTDRIRVEIQSMVAILRAIDEELIAIKENQKEVVETLSGFFDRMEVFASEELITKDDLEGLSKLSDDIKTFRKIRHI